MLGEYTREIIVEPTITVTGQAPPGLARSWWPWIAAALVVGGLVYFTREEGRGGGGPLGDGG
jgi:hypothetical protein